MRKINIHEAKTHLSRLVDEAAAGETIIVAKAGKPVAKLVPLDAKDAPPQRRDIGFLDGKYKVPENFDTMFQDEIIAMFEGRE